MNVTYRVYKDYQVNFAGRSDEEIFADPDHQQALARLRYSFVSMCWHPTRKRLFIGATNSGGDLLIEYNPSTGKFRSCVYQRSGLWDPTQSKIHKGIWLDEREDALYFGTSTLRGIPETVNSKGGRLVRYRVADRKFDLLGAPTPGDFYQTICYDPGRKKVYMYTLPGSCFAVYDLRKKKLIRHDQVSSIPHIGAIDDEGGVWGTYGREHHSFFRYLPDEDRYEFPKGCAFPEAWNAADVMYKGAGPIDAMINGGDGYLYAGSALAEVVRIDPVSKEVKYLGKPFPGIRLSGMYLAADGFIYMCGGSDRRPMLARYHRDTGAFEPLGEIKAADGTTCFRCHELVVVDGVAYVGETDNRRRSGYLWVCEL